MHESASKTFSLAGKVAIITGTTRGLGQALAEGLLEFGAKVVALDRSQNDHLQKFSELIGGTFKRIRIDLVKSSEGELRNIIQSVADEFSRVDILVNNAGITRRGEVQEFDNQDWLDVMHVNLNVPFYLSKAVSEFFIQQGSGKIINMASMLSYQGGIRVPSYASSKHGVVGLTRSFANGLGKYGICVNAIAPGFFSTDLTRPLQDDRERNESILKRIPMGRWGRSEDLKGALIFLASSMSNYVNGTIITVDGGWLSN